jgi:hypothetical protein
MTNSEFSDAFDVLLNSYNTQAQFGEQASKREIVLDEYEKSVLLTQAQDIIVKSYFDRNLNPQGQGLDDSTRRQIDFSSLIKVTELSPAEVDSGDSITKEWNDGNGYLGTIKVTNISAAPITVTIGATTNQSDHGVDILYTPSSGSTPASITIQCNNQDFVAAYSEPPTLETFFNAVKDFNVIGATKLSDLLMITVIDSSGEEIDSDDYTMINTTLNIKSKTHMTFDDRGMLFVLPSKTVENENISEVLFILNEKMIVDGKSYVIVPISYSEYDRKMSKPYSQPLKKQAWRLFQNISTGFDIYSELIPRWNLDVSDVVYRIRYVKRPRPIVLEDIGDLNIDGENKETTCELNPSLHVDILNKAVELAISTRGGGSAVESRQKS